jgi:RNA polymerase sigma-70 factor (ECF subfamily)
LDNSNLISFESALEQFIANTKSQQLAILANMVSMAEAEEILQEAYLKIYMLANKNPNKEQPLEQLMSLKPMLYSIVKNLAISNIRHQKVVNLHLQKSGGFKADNEALQSQSSEFDLMKKEQDDLLLSAINQLPPICRQVFVQRKLHSKSHADIAVMLGISTKTVESHLAKGLALCRAFVRKSKQHENNTLRVNSI